MVYRIERPYPYPHTITWYTELKVHCQYLCPWRHCCTEN